MSHLNWLIPKRNKVCSKGNEQLNHGAEYFSVLLPSNTELQWHRQDFCSACWHATKQEHIQSGHPFWKATVNKPKIEKLDSATMDAKALALLQEALRENTLEAQENAFILSLYLARRKLIVLRQQLSQENCTFNLYEILETEEIISVKKLSLNDLRIHEIQNRISVRMQSDD